MDQEHVPVPLHRVSAGVGAQVGDVSPRRAVSEQLPSLMFCGTLRDAEMEDAIDVQSPVVNRDNRRINRKAG